MCACKFRRGNADILATQGFTTLIPSSSFLSGNTYYDFLFYRCISESKWNNALSTIRIDNNTTLSDKIKTDEDVKKLATYADNGQDVAKWNVRIKDLLGSITFEPSELENASCKRVAFSND